MWLLCTICNFIKNLCILFKTCSDCQFLYSRRIFIGTLVSFTYKGFGYFLWHETQLSIDLYMKLSRCIKMIESFPGNITRSGAAVFKKWVKQFHQKKSSWWGDHYFSMLNWMWIIYQHFAMHPNGHTPTFCQEVDEEISVLYVVGETRLSCKLGQIKGLLDMGVNMSWKKGGTM